MFTVNLVKRSIEAEEIPPSDFLSHYSLRLLYVLLMENLAFKAPLVVFDSRLDILLELSIQNT